MKEEEAVVEVEAVAEDEAVAHRWTHRHHHSL